MATIEVDFEVFKALTAMRATELDTYNDVIRRRLGLGLVETPQAEPLAWTWKGVTLPSGTELRADYKGKAYTAKIVSGQWMQDGKPKSSPSAAAYDITQSGVNGWRFWLVKRPSDTAWLSLDSLRPA